MALADSQFSPLTSNRDVEMSQDPLETRIILGDQDDVVARAVLLILQTVTASREQSAQAGDWRFVPEGDVLSAREAMERLRRMPKPLVCEAVRVDSVIEVRCGQPTENPRWEWWARTDADTPTLSERERGEIERTGNRRILLAGATESIVLDLDQLEQLSRDYVILGNYTVSSFRASRLDPSLDVAVVQRYSPSTSATTVKTAES